MTRTHTWRAIVSSCEEEAPFDVESLRRTREKRLEEFARGIGIIGLNLQLAENRALRLLIARGPEVVREALRPLVPYARREAEQMFTEYYRDDDPVGTGALASATGVCMYECLGLDPDGALAVFKPHLVRIETSRRDKYVYHHWNRALAAIAVDDPRTWKPIAGFLPSDPVQFVPGSTFSFNVQGFIAHLAGAITHGRSVQEVLPAWQNFVDSYPELQASQMADTGTLLWASRLVNHHIARQQLGTTAAFLHDEINAAVAAERA